MQDTSTATPPAASDIPTLPDITLTDLAAERVKGSLLREGRPGDALRVAVAGGGCSGMQYHLSFASEATPSDHELQHKGVRVLVDAKSIPYLQGITIDYVNALHGAGFKFINPNAERTCGCGSSFSVDS